MTSYQYRKSHCGDKTILRPSYLHNGISYTCKTTSLYWIRAQLTTWTALFSFDLIILHGVIRRKLSPWWPVSTWMCAARCNMLSWCELEIIEIAFFYRWKLLSQIPKYARRFQAIIFIIGLNNTCSLNIALDWVQHFFVSHAIEKWIYIFKAFAFIWHQWN